MPNVSNVLLSVLALTTINAPAQAGLVPQICKAGPCPTHPLPKAPVTPVPKIGNTTRATTQEILECLHLFNSQVRNSVIIPVTADQTEQAEFCLETFKEGLLL